MNTLNSGAATDSHKSIPCRLRQAASSLFRRIAALILIWLGAACPAAAQQAAADSLLQKLQSIPDRQLRMKALYDTATIKYADDAYGNMLLARAFFKENEAHPTDTNTVKANFLMGDAVLMSGRYEEALRYSIAALKLAKRIHMFEAQANIHSNISGIYLRMGNIEQSLQQIRDGLAVARAHQLPVNEARLMDFLGVRYAILKQYDSAFLVYDAALIKAQRLGLRRLAGNILLNKSITYSLLRKYDLALLNLNRALRLADTPGNRNEIANLHFQMSQVYSDMHQFARAEQECRLALANSGGIADPQFSLAVYGNLSYIYAQKGDYKTAFDYKSREMHLQDSVFNIQRTAQISELQTRYDTEVKDNKLAAQEAQIGLDRKTNLLLSISVGALLLIGAIIFLNQRKTKRLYRQIVRQQEDLTLKTSELERLNSVKDRLFSTISHDLRAPVSSLLAFTMLLDQGNIPPEQLALYAADLKQQLGITATLMEHLLHFARSQMKGYHARIEKVSLAGITADAVGLAQPAADRKGITLRNEVTQVSVLGDVHMLALIIRNLLDNAIKFTQAGGCITLTSGQTADGHGCWMVRDNGIGIEAPLVAAFNHSTGTDEQPLENTAGTDGEQGTGLGLMLSKTFLTLMGGRMALASSKGQGSTFTVCLPAAM